MKKHRTGRRAAALGLSLVLALPCAGCEAFLPEEPPAQDTAADTAAAPGAKKEPGYFGLAWDSSEPVSPVTSRTQVNHLLIEALYEGLFELGPDFEPVPVLCESFEGGGLSWTFTLKEGVTFWSGEPLTASDVAACWKVAMQSESSPYHARFADVADISADGNRVSVTLKTPNAQLPRLLDVPVCRAGTANDTFADGTGPFRAVEENGRWQLRRNEGWHGGKVTAFDTVTLVNAAHSEALSAGFGTGDISVSRMQGVTARRGGSVNICQTRTTSLHYLGLNHEHGALSQPVVRQALGLLIQRDALCASQLQNCADPAALPVNPQPAPAQDAQDAADPAGMLRAAGFEDTNGDGVLDYIPPPTPWYTPYWHEAFAPSILVNSGNAYKVAAAQQIAATLQAAGIGATVNAVPYEEYVKALERGNFDMYYGETLLTADFDLRPLVSEGGALNYGGYADEAFEAAMAAYRAGGDAAAYYAAFSEAVPVLPLAFGRAQVVTRAGLLVNFAPLPHQLFAGVEDWEAR